MYVEARAVLRNEDIRRVLKKSDCKYGDQFELEDALAEVWINNGWVVPVKKPNDPAVEFAANAGAPETALSPRGRGGMRTKPPETA